MLSYYPTPSSSCRNLHSRLPFNFLSDWPPNPNAKKEKMRKVSQCPISPFTFLQKHFPKRFNLMIESLLWNNIWHHFKFIIIIASTHGKNLWPPTKKGTMIHVFRKTKDCRQHAPVTYATCVLIVCDSKCVNSATFGVILIIYNIL